MELAEKGLIGTLIVKDHSRLGRNRLIVGQLLEEGFDSLGVRYIAIMDNIDTAKGISDLVPMQDLFNEWHAKNTSQKVRNVFKSKGMSGAPLTTNPPFGYLKDPESKNGWIIDEAAEIAALEANIRNGETVTREANYSQTAASHDGADWGNTYVEVDLTNQYLYLFVNGAIVTQGPIVTGKPSRGDATPQGVYILKYKEKDTTLRGPKKEDGSYEWESPVTYWMPFNGGIGLHDAPWQTNFGGDWYLEHGSRGCVNLQYDVAETVFNNVDSGTPVVCHY